MRKLVLLCLLLMTTSATAQTLFLNESSITVPAPLRGGINLGSFTPYDSGEMFKNLLRTGNWNFEPTQLHQIFALTANGTVLSFSNTNQYDVLVANDMAGATFTVVDSQSNGQEVGCSGTVASNTSGNGTTAGSVYTISPLTNQGVSGCSAPFTTGDIVLVYLNQYPTAESCWESGGNCDISGSVTNGGKLTTDTTTPYDGQQSLVLDATASSTATADVKLYFNTSRFDIFALLSGTYTVNGYVRLYSGTSTPLTVSVLTPTGTCSGSVAVPTTTWTPFTVNCSLNETNATAPTDHWIDFKIAGSGGLGALEIDDVGFQKTSGLDSTNTTVFRDEVVAALRSVCATGTAGPPCLVRNWTNQNGETTANWTNNAGQAAMTYASSAYSQNGEITPQLQEYLGLVQLVGGLPYLVFPCTATATDAANFIEYMSSTDTSTGYGLIRANQGQTAPWVGSEGVFSMVWVSFCNESWNGPSFMGQGLPYRGTAGSQFYFDYSNRAKDIYAAMRGNPYFSSNMKLGFNLEMLDNSQLSLPASLQAMAAAGGAVDYAEIAPYTQATVSNWQTDNALWQSALEEPWGNVADPKSSSTFYQNVQLVEGIEACGPSGTAPCNVTVYEEANGSLATCGLASNPACKTPTYKAIDQTHEDYMTAGAGQGVITPLQMLLNQQQLGISAQNYFALSGFENSTLSGSTATLAKLWGCTVDMGGSTSYLNQTEYTFRPACLGLQIANQSIVGPEYSAIFTTGLPTYTWSGDAYNGPTDALSSVPYVYAFCFKAQSSGTARSCVFINTSLNNPYTVTFVAPSVPSGNCITRQFAPVAIDALNEAPSPSATNGTAASVSIKTNSITCSSTLALPVNSVTALDFTSNGTPSAATPAFSVGAGTYISGQTITITDATTSATIYYTIDGSTPTSSSAVYSLPIAISSSETLNAVAVASGYLPSAVQSAAYAIITPATPTFSPISGTYSAPVTVTINEASSGTTIYYTTDGTIPTSLSAVYSAPIVVNSTDTLKAIAIVSGNLSGAVGTASYAISAATPIINYASGFTSTGMNLYGATISNNVLHITDGGTAEGHVAWFATTVNVQAFTTDFTFQNTQATANGFTFSVQDAPAGIYAVGGNGSALGYAGIGTSVAIKFDLHNSNGEGSDSTGFYTNGATPTVPSVDMTSSEVNLHSADVLQAHITYDGTTLTLTLTDTVTGASFTTSTAINIPSIVGANKAFVGFTGGTGAQTAIQDILTWSYVPSAFTPTFTPAAGSYISAQAVTISDTTTGAAIYYTTDGTIPSSASTKYTSAITVSAAQTLKAVAVAAGYANSATGSAAYVINGAAAAPTFFPTAGPYGPSQTVAISDTTASASIYYTTNGNVPTTASILYSTPIQVSDTETINAIAVASKFANSPVASAAYTINGSSTTPTFSPAAGTYGPVQNITISDTTAGAILCYTTDGSTPTSSSTVYTGPVIVSSTQTLKAIAIATNYLNSAIGSAAYTINGPSATPIFSPAPGSYGPTQSVSITDTIAGVAIYYTTDGSIPSNASTLYSGPIAISTSGTLNAIAISSNYADSAIGSGVYTINGPAGTPTFSPLPGAYGPSQTITIIDATQGATIYYTTNGTAPSSASSMYSGPITVNASETLNAIAIAPNFLNSTVGSGTFTINGPAAVPSFSPTPGPYGPSQSVMISDTTPGSAIYYTTDGTVLSSGSTLYTGPISVGVTQTVTAIAIAPNYSNSSIGSGAYMINGQAATPILSVLAGAYGTAQTVSIMDSTASVVIYYTTDGTIPTNASTLYTGSILVSGSETLSAIAIAPNYTSSAVASASYTINGSAALPVFSPAPGSYGPAQTVSIGDATPGASIYFTTDGTTPTSASTLYTGSILVSSSETLSALAIAPNFANSAVSSATYSINGAVAIPSFSPAGGSYGSAQTVVINDTNSIAAIYYTTDGTTPSNASTLYTASILVSANETINAIGIAANYANSAVGTATYTISRGTASPTFSPSPGSYGSSQTVTLSDTTPGAAIYYTTDGTTPSSASTIYNDPILVNATETITAIAIAPNFSNSAVVSGTYSIYGSPVGNLEEAVDASTGSTTISSMDTLFAGGWAADPVDGSPLTNVKVFIDGVPAGTPTLGIARPDVAAALNNPAYANSGFTFYSPVASLAVGPHTVTVVATNSHGLSTTLGTIAITVTVVYAAPVGNLEQAVDSVTGSTTVATTDSLFIAGWVADPVDGSPLSNVTVSIDGVSIGTPTLGLARPDVASYFNNPTYANSGFTLNYSASRLSLGTHTVTVVAVNSHSVTTTLGPRTVTVVAGNSNSAPIGNLEEAVDASTGSSTIAVTDSLVVSGWVADPSDGSPMSNVTVWIDGVSIGAPALGLARPDVASYFNDPAYANSGFSLVYSAGRLSSGTHTVTVVAVNSHAVTTTLGPKTITVTPPNGNVAPVGSLEDAVDSVTGATNVSQSTGSLFVSGWAADYEDNGPAKTVQILIDGIAAGQATLGEARPDVAAYYNNSAWGSTGYQLIMLASSLNIGTHSITAVATDSLSLSTTFGPLTFLITQ